ncbi:hypothetical protein V8E53_001377, partial [Lactarius tabidus]
PPRGIKATTILRVKSLAAIDKDLTLDHGVESGTRSFHRNTSLQFQYPRGRACSRLQDGQLYHIHAVARGCSHLPKTFQVSTLQWTISTIVNNPHKKSAPPKAHASVPPAPHVELPHVHRKDFAPYISAIGSEWEAFQHNLVLGCATSIQLEEPDLDGPPRTLRLPKLLPPLPSI